MQPTESRVFFVEKAKGRWWVEAVSAGHDRDPNRGKAHPCPAEVSQLYAQGKPESQMNSRDRRFRAVVLKVWCRAHSISIHTRGGHFTSGARAVASESQGGLL